MQTEPFSHAGKEYEVRVISDGQSVFVKVFKGMEPANGFRYEVTLMTMQDAANVMGIDVVKHLIKTAKADVTSL